jgi:hypothetical protein
MPPAFVLARAEGPPLPCAAADRQLRVIRDRCSQTCLPVYVRFAPKAEQDVGGQAQACSIKVASSAGAFELFTRRDTAHFRNRSSGAGFKYSMPALPVSQGSNYSWASRTGMRSWMAMCSV